MTDQELEQRLRAWYHAEIDDGESAPISLRTSLAAMAHTPTTSAGLFGSRRSLALLAAAMLTALLIGGAIAVGSGLVRLPSVLPPSSSPEASADASSTPTPAPLGGGLILTFDRNTSPDFDVLTLDPASGARTLLGTVSRDDARVAWLVFQWAPDRKHVLMTDQFLQRTLILAAPTDAGRKLIFICCDLPTDVWQGGSSPEDGWVLSPRGDRVAALHTSEIQIPGAHGPTGGITDGVVVADIDGTGLHALLLPPGADVRGGGLSWSPDQSAVAVRACLPCNNADYGKPPTTVQHEHLFIVPLDGSPVRELLDETRGGFFPPAWSQDGSTLATVLAECHPGEVMPDCHSDQTFSLMLVAVADGGQRTLVTGDQVGGPLEGIGAPMWSGDGRRIAFSASSGDGTDSNIFVVDADGSNLIKLVDGSLVQWSPDGEWLLFSRPPADQNVSSDLWIIAANGSEPRHLGTFPIWASSRAW